MVPPSVAALRFRAETGARLEGGEWHLGPSGPSPADVSSGAKERTGREREEKEPSVTFHFSPGGAFQLPWSRPLAPEMGQVTSDRSRE